MTELKAKTRKLKYLFGNFEYTKQDALDRLHKSWKSMLEDDRWCTINVKPGGNTNNAIVFADGKMYHKALQYPRKFMEIYIYVQDNKNL